MHVSKLHEPNVCQSSGTKSTVANCISSGTSSGCDYARNDNSVPSSSLQVQFRSVDDYKCSICGIKMPPEFVYERQEHSDFHLAERLQEECSSSRLINQSSSTPKRVVQEDQNASPAGQKRRKSTAEQGKFLPIDKLFKKRTLGYVANCM